MRVRPYDLSISQRPHLLIPSPLGVRISAWTLGRHIQTTALRNQAALLPYNFIYWGRHKGLPNSGGNKLFLLMGNGKILEEYREPEFFCSHFLRKSVTDSIIFLKLGCTFLRLNRLRLFFFKINVFIYLFLAALGLHCCAQAFSGWSEQGLLFIAVCGLLIVVVSRCGAWALGAQSSVVVARRLLSYGSRDLERRPSSCGARA